MTVKGHTFLTDLSGINQTGGGVLHNKRLPSKGGTEGHFNKQVRVSSEHKWRDNQSSCHACGHASQVYPFTGGSSPQFQ